MDSDISLAIALERFCTRWQAFEAENKILQEMYGIREASLTYDISQLTRFFEKGGRTFGTAQSVAAVKRFDLGLLVLCQFYVQMKSGVLIAFGRKRNWAILSERQQIPCDYWSTIPTIDFIDSRVVFPSGVTFEEVSVTEPLLCKSPAVLRDVLFGKTLDHLVKKFFLRILSLSGCQVV